MNIMRTQVILLLSTCFLGACASTRSGTSYRQAIDKRDNGYSIVPGKEEKASFFSIFKGDKWTPSKRAYIYTVLAAYDYCAKQGKHAIVGKPENFSKEENYTQVSSYSLPTYDSSGNYLYSQTHVSSSPVKNVYPRYMTTFVCEKTHKSVENLLKNEREDISKELVHPITGDFSGGVLINDKNAKTPFRNKDVILAVGNRRIENRGELNHAINAIKSKQGQLKIIRNKKIRFIKVKVEDITPDIKIYNSKRIKFLCERLDAMTSDHYRLKDSGIIPKVCQTHVDTESSIEL